MALKGDGTVWTWGADEKGQLGTGKTGGGGLPVMVPISGKASDIDAGNNLSVVLTGDGAVWACGDNSGGQLWTGNTVSVSTPLKVGSLKKMVAISCGAQHALALAENGDL